MVYQLYFWDNELRMDREPKTKVVKTLGVKPSRDEAERGLRETGRKLEYPRAPEIVKKDISVDDCFSGERT